MTQGFPLNPGGAWLSAIEMMRKLTRKLMRKSLGRRKAKKVTVRELHSQFRRLRARVEDLEDLRDLNAAIERNGGKPGIRWDQVEKELGLETFDLPSKSGFKARRVSSSQSM